MFSSKKHVELCHLSQWLDCVFIGWKCSVCFLTVTTLWISVFCLEHSILSHILFVHYNIFSIYVSILYTYLKFRLMHPFLNALKKIIIGYYKIVNIILWTLLRICFMYSFWCFLKQVLNKEKVGRKISTFISLEVYQHFSIVPSIFLYIVFFFWVLFASK